jgi:hypothetical protein
MKTPIIRLTIGQNVTLSGYFINHNDKVMPYHQRCDSEYNAMAQIDMMRNNDNEFQLVIIRQNETVGV